MARADRLHIPLRDADLAVTPLKEDHREALRAACAADTQIWSIYPVSYDPAHFEQSFEALIDNKARYPFAVLLSGEVVGMTAYLNIDADRDTLEIGNSYLAPARRGTGLNGRVKRLLVEHAFAQGFSRVELRVDARNTRSQAAVAKLGALRTAILRAERTTWTGHIRDTFVYTLLPGDPPWAREALLSPPAAVP